MGRFAFLLAGDGEVVVRLVENYKARGHGNGLNQLFFREMESELSSETEIQAI